MTLAITLEKEVEKHSKKTEPRCKICPFEAYRSGVQRHFDNESEGSL